MFSETGSIMRQSIKKASDDCSAIIAAVERLLESPPPNRFEIGKAIGGLFKSIYRLEAAVAALEVGVVDVLYEAYQAVNTNLERVEERLDVLFDKGSDDPLYFVLRARELLVPLRDLKQSLDDMEDERKENSKMSRV